MGTFKKISYLIAAIYIIAACVVLPSFAAAEDQVSLNFNSPFYLFQGLKDPNSQLSYPSNWSFKANQWYNTSSTANPSVLPSSYYRSDFTGSTVNSNADICYGFSGQLVDENGIVDGLHNDYSYEVVFTVIVSVSKNFDNVDTAPSVFPYDYELWFTYTRPGSSDFPGLGIIPADDAILPNFNATIDRVETTGNTPESYNYYQYTYGFVFHVPNAEDFPISPNLSWLNLVTFYTNYSGNYGSAGFPFQYVKFQSIQGVYDPTGDSTDDMQNDVDQIIAGQREAAEYALQLEQQASESALEGALDNADTSGLSLTETFGGSLTNLYNAITYTGTAFDIKLPSSGTVPLLNTQLWEDTTIPIKEYIDKVPSIVWVVINFLLWFMVVRAVIKLVHKIIDLIGGGSNE